MYQITVTLKVFDICRLTVYLFRERLFRFFRQKLCRGLQSNKIG